MSNPQTGSFVEFYMESVELKSESEKAGRPIYKEIPFVRIQHPGDRLNVLEVKADAHYKQRYALSSGGNDAEFEDFENDAAARENIGALKNGPGELWYLKGVNAVGQFAPADPATFTNPVKEFVRAMASITSTPLHYFEKSGNIPSGEALRTAEGPLMKKVEDRQISFGSAWRDLFRFMLRIEGINSDVEIKWQQVETMDSLDAWEVAVKKRLVGVNLEQVLVEMGYDLEIAQNIAQNADVAALSQNMNTTNILRENGVQA